MSGRAILLAALERSLFPALRAAGFVGPVKEEDERDPEHAAVNASLHFRKARAGAAPGVVLVHVKRFLRPTFEVIGGQVPPGGVELLDPPGVVPPDRVTADMLPEQAYLQSSPGHVGSRPFRQPLWAFLAGTSLGVEEAVLRAVHRLPVLLAWIEDRQASPWLWVIRWR